MKSYKSKKLSNNFYREITNQLRFRKNMQRKVCSFCKEEKFLTKEHLWPASLHKRLKKANSQNIGIFWLSKLDKEIPSEPQIKDVCAECNNNTLSALDGYICKLFDKYFITTPERYDEVEFEFDYHLLMRWLLKTSFNSARVNKSVDLKTLEDLLPYILNKDLSIGRSVQLFIQLTYPEKTDEYLAKKIGEELIVYPQSHRSGHLLFKAGVDKKLLRTISLRAYNFYIAFWYPGSGRSEQIDFEKAFTELFRETKILRPSFSRVKLKCNGLGAIESIKDSRSKFNFSEL